MTNDTLLGTNIIVVECIIIKQSKSACLWLGEKKNIYIYMMKMMICSRVNMIRMVIVIPIMNGSDTGDANGDPSKCY